MICEKYKHTMDANEDLQFISELIHCVKSDNHFFDVARSVIEEGKRNGLFDKVEFRPNLIGKPDINSDLRKEIEDTESQV